MNLRDIIFKWQAGHLVENDTLEACANLFSDHYGIWGEGAPKRKKGTRVKFSSQRIRKLLEIDGAWLACALYDNYLIGYAVLIHSSIENLGTISWVTQLVVHENYRKLGIAKNLLTSIYGFSDHYAWGLVTANPRAVRALERATRRRVKPSFVATNQHNLQKFAEQYISYVASANFYCDDTTSKVDTEFFVDHQNLAELIKHSSRESSLTWDLGNLDPGQEWLAFTFNTQETFPISYEDLNLLLEHSEQKLWQAYERMTVDESHLWAKFAEAEIDYLIEHLEITSDTKILDLGCGTGRHAIILAKHGLKVTAVDMVHSLIERGKEAAAKIGVDHNCSFKVGDARELQNVYGDFDLILCLYDVVGSFVRQEDNIAILKSIVDKLKPGGYAVISVMSMTLTQIRAKNKASLRDDPNFLFSLPPSNNMETSGEVFDPEYFLLDETEGIVYRREQFIKGNQIPAEIVVRDRRYTLKEISHMVEEVGLEVIEARPVRAGKFNEAATEDVAKEIFVIARRPL